MVFSGDLDRHVGRVLLSALAAEDEAVGEQAQGEFVAVAFPFAAGVVEEEEAFTDAGDAGGEHVLRNRD